MVRKPIKPLLVTLTPEQLRYQLHSARLRYISAILKTADAREGKDWRAVAEGERESTLLDQRIEALERLVK